MTFIALYEGCYGTGNTLEGAFESLKEAISYITEFEEIRFYEAKEIGVEMKIVQKPTVELNVKK